MASAASCTASLSTASTRARATTSAPSLPSRPPLRPSSAPSSRCCRCEGPGEGGRGGRGQGAGRGAELTSGMPPSSPADACASCTSACCPLVPLSYGLPLAQRPLPLPSAAARGAEQPGGGNERGAHAGGALQLHRRHRHLHRPAVSRGRGRGLQFCLRRGPWRLRWTALAPALDQGLGGLPWARPTSAHALRCAAPRCMAQVRAHRRGGRAVCHHH